MAIFWATEPIPLPVTALFPVVLLPILGLSSTENACAPYLKGICFLIQISVQD
jgi:sodium-dependent dicarboxylate transporter 2/3/5